MPRPGTPGLAPLLAALVLAVSVPSVTHAQLGDLTGKLKKKVQTKVDQKVDKAMNTAVECAFGDQACIDKAKKEGRQVTIVGEDGKALPSGGASSGAPTAAGSAGGKAGTGVWRNYDFTPGRTVWAATDFSNERVGRFPASQLEFVKGNMQIVDLNGAKVLEISESSVFRLKLEKSLPPDFTLEFDAQIGAPNMAINVYFTRLETAHARFPSHYLGIWQRPGIYFKGNGVSAISGAWKLNQTLHPVKFQADGEYALLYLGHERAGNLPNATIARSDEIEFHVTANANYRAYIKDIVVAVGLDKLYETLKAKGEYTTRGIYFDTDRHEIRPESTPTLEELHETLAGHADLKITIEGHTDSQGEDAHNQALSGRRAESVKQYLVANGIAAARIRTVGHGESKPVADNTTSSGRQENRRVVVRLDG